MSRSCDTLAIASLRFMSGALVVERAPWGVYVAERLRISDEERWYTPFSWVGVFSSVRGEGRDSSMSFLHPKMERRRNPPTKSLLLNIVVYVMIGIYYLCKGNFFLVINMKRLSVFLILLILLPFVVGCKHRDVSPQYR